MLGELSGSLSVAAGCRMAKKLVGMFLNLIAADRLIALSVFVKGSADRGRMSGRNERAI